MGVCFKNRNKNKDRNNIINVTPLKKECEIKSPNTFTESSEIKTLSINFPAAKPIIESFLPIEQKSSNNNAEAAEPIRALPSKVKNKIDNIIKMRFKIEQKDVNKPIKILYNMKYVIQGCNIRELNDKNTELYIDNKRTKYQSYFTPEKEGIYDIKLKISIKLKSYTGLFYDLYYLQEVDLSSFDAQELLI